MSYAELAAAVRQRRREIDAIEQYAKLKGLDVKPGMVMRRFDVWMNWYVGNLATGYLIKSTGVRYRSRRKRVSNDTTNV